MFSFFFIIRGIWPQCNTFTVICRQMWRFGVTRLAYFKWKWCVMFGWNRRYNHFLQEIKENYIYKKHILKELKAKEQSKTNSCKSSRKRFDENYSWYTFHSSIETPAPQSQTVTDYFQDYLDLPPNSRTASKLSSLSQGLCVKDLMARS